MKIKKSLKLILISIALILTSIQSFSQKDSVWNVLVIKKGRSASVDSKKPYLFNPDGFYLHRNMLYNLQLTDGSTSSGLLMDIKKDSLVVANYFNRAVAERYNDTFLIQTLHYSAFKKLRLIADRSLLINNKINLSKYSFQFEKDTFEYKVNTRLCPVYYKDTVNNCDSCSKCYYSLGNNWVDLINEEEGYTYYYMGPSEYEVDSARIRKRLDTTWVTRNIIGFAPTGKDTKINGWAISAMAVPSYREDTLIINGLNTEIGMGLIMLPLILNGLGDPMPTEEFKKNHQGKESTTINGLSISALGNVNKYGKINGVSLNGAITSSNEVNGLAASFGANIVYEFNGLIICGLRNHSVIGNGVQIGLVNKCKKLRGFQFGLINKNQKRTLPFINWCFSD